MSSESEVRQDAIQAFIAGQALPANPLLSEEQQALYVEPWFPAAVRLEHRTILVRVWDEGPDPTISDEIVKGVRRAGLQHLGDNWPLIESITLQLLGVLGASWQVWGQSMEKAESAVGSTAMDADSTPLL